MKKNIIVIFLLILSAVAVAQDSVVVAQEKEKLPFSFGPLIGTNVSRLSTRGGDYPLVSNINNTDIIGFHGGIFARIHYRKVYFQPELIVSLKGGKCSYDALLTDPANPAQTISTGITQTMRITSLDIPVLIGYNLGRNLLNFRVFAGPMGSYTLAEKVNVSTDGLSLPADGHLNVKQFAWSVTGGIGMDLYKFFIEARYERGLNNLSSNKSFKQYPGSFVLSVGWKTF